MAPPHTQQHTHNNTHVADTMRTMYSKKHEDIPVHSPRYISLLTQLLLGGTGTGCVIASVSQGTGLVVPRPKLLQFPRGRLHGTYLNGVSPCHKPPPCCGHPRLDGREITLNPRLRLCQIKGCKGKIYWGFAQPTFTDHTQSISC